MKLYTKSGDDGTTGLIGNRRVSKSDQRIAAYGDVDETNAAIGIVLAASADDPELADPLRRIQSDLFVLGAQLATPGDRQPKCSINKQLVEQLEHWIDESSARVPPLKQFVLPGGSTTAAGLHLARTICRRAERAVVALAKDEPVDPLALVYLNRLSDLLFALARQANQLAGVEDIPWTAPEQT